MSLPEEGAGKPEQHAANFRDMLRLMMANQARSPPHSVVAASEHSSSSESTDETNDDDRANVEEESNAETNDDDRANVGEVSEHSSSPDVGLAGLLSQLRGPVSHVLYDRVVDHLNSEDLHFEKYRDDNVIKLCFAGNNANYNIFFDVKEEKDCIIVYVMSPVKIPKKEKKGLGAPFWLAVLADTGRTGSAWSSWQGGAATGQEPRGVPLPRQWLRRSTGHVHRRNVVRDHPHYQQM